MPYSIPAPMPAPLPIHSKGRTGHRRSFSYDDENNGSNVAAVKGDGARGVPSTAGPTTGGAFASLGALPRRKPASFHIEADDDDDSSPEEGGNSSPQENSTTTSSGKPANLPSDDDRDDDDASRGLPPLKLRIPSFSSSGKASPTLANLGSAGIPFPRTSSPQGSRTSSADNLLKIRSTTPSTPSTPQSADPSRPSFSRTASTPILLSNGKPLKSSLKSSSSSPNIPFPSQSLVPSRIYAEIARMQAEEGHHGESSPIHSALMVPITQRHIRAASAPATPNLNSSTSSPSDSFAPTPDESFTAPTTPSAPKAVHFPSSEEGGLATIKIFKRTAKPVAVSVPGASGGEETETETDGEGYNSGGGASSGWAYHAGWGGWGSGYSNPWDRYTSKNTTSPATPGKGPQGYPFPRIAKDAHPKHSPSPLSKSNTGNGRERKEKKRIVYEMDMDTSSTVPKRDLSMFDNVFLESIKLSSSMPQDSSSDSSSSEEDGLASTPKYSDKMQTTLEGTLLVRNLTYEKFVSIRFTLDDWHTTSEVKASYKESLEKLPKKWLKAVRGDRSTSEADDDTSLASSNPQWDRFEFSINLSDYARSRSLASRVLWLVVRYNTPGPVRYPVAVPLMSSFTSEVVGRSDPEMLTLLANGLGGTSDSHSQGRLVMESELRKSNMIVEGVEGNEWWDNNATGNYKIGFREREIIAAREPKPASVTKEEVAAVDPVAQQAQAQTLAKRRSTISCPPAFTNAPPPPASLTHLPPSSLSPPQLSTSTSVDSYQPQQAWPTQRAPATNKAMAETTLERLKRLNLRNYAAPGTGAGRAATAAPAGRVLAVPPPVSIPAAPVPQPQQYRLREEQTHPVRHDSLSSSSSTSSLNSGTNSETSTNDSTPLTSPLHTPTISHVDIVLAGEDHEEKQDRLWYSDEKSEGRKNQQLEEVDGSTTPTLSNQQESVPADVLSPLLSPFGGPDMGSSPPFSSLANIGISKFPVSLPSSGMATPKATTTFGDVESTPVPVLPRGPTSLILEDIREKSTSSPPRSPSGSGRNSPVERGATQDQTRRRVSPPASANASSSDSGSGSSSKRRNHHGHRGSSSASLAVHGGRPGGLGLTFGSGQTSPSGSRSPLSPLSLSGSQTNLKNQMEEIRDPDSIYQAFVRQWCFASEPAPAHAGYGGMTADGSRRKAI